MIYVMFGIVALLVGFCGHKYIKQILIFFHLDLKKKYVKVLHWIITLAVVGICMNFSSVPAIIVFYTLLFAGVFNLLFWILQRILHRKEKSSGNLKILQGRLCLLPVVLAVLFIGYGAVNMNRIHHTVYDIVTDKIDGSYEIALVTDTHYGTVQNTDLLKEEMEALSREKPDLLILGGDIVEEGTSRKQMEEVFRIFGSVDTKYGVYFVYGNHDQQHYTAEKAYSKADLERFLAENNITLLADTYAEIDGALILAGRDDAGYGLPGSRKAIDALLQGVSREKYLIVADHQPVDVGECASAGVDLMLSGHTHAGQIWPLGLLLQISGNYNYGLYDGETCKVIVSSGFTGWGYPMRTEGKCEYVLIRLKGDGQ